MKSSYYMEIEGLIRSMNCFKENNVSIRKFVTDRHVQIVKWIRENMKNTKHCVDIWHVAKGFYKEFCAINFIMNQLNYCNIHQSQVRVLSQFSPSVTRKFFHLHDFSQV